MSYYCKMCGNIIESDHLSKCSKCKSIRIARHAKHPEPLHNAGSVVITNSHKHLANAFHGKTAVVEKTTKTDEGEWRYHLKFTENIHWHGNNAHLVVPIEMIR